MPDGRAGNPNVPRPNDEIADGARREVRARLPVMEFNCADCGCLVDRGVNLEHCDNYPDCCCSHLPLSDKRTA